MNQSTRSLALISVDIVHRSHLLFHFGASLWLCQYASSRGRANMSACSGLGLAWLNESWRVSWLTNRHQLPCRRTGPPAAVAQGCSQQELTHGVCHC